jgi:dihydroorotate dehydrogenase electron transfer subunit
MTTKSKLPLRLLRNEPLTADASLLTFALPLGLALGCRPGQFFNLRPLDSTAPLLRRPISICDVRPKENEVDFLIQVIGDGTRLLCETRPGAEVDAVGPLGTSFQTDPARPALMVAGGVGVAPLYFLARQMRREAAAQDSADGTGSVFVRARPCSSNNESFSGAGPAGGGAHSAASPSITFCYGARSASHLVLLDRIEREVSRLVLATEDGSRGAKGLVTDAARDLLQPGAQIFVCGPPAMMQTVLVMMRERGLEGQFSLENQMGCGVGACMGCVVPSRGGFLRVCCDGPVVQSQMLDSVFTG